MILEGALKEGDPLPSVRTVAAEYRVNPLTVLKVNNVTPLAPKDAHYVLGINPITTLRNWLAPVLKLL